MKKYELTYLIPSELSDIEFQKEIESFIADNKGEVLNVKTDPAKRELGDEIKGRRDARMNSLVFTMDPTHITGLEKIVKEKDDLLRHLLVNKPEIKPDKKRGEKKADVERKPSNKVELKDIDKKIEEILSE